MFNTKLKKQLEEKDKAIEILQDTLKKFQEERKEIIDENIRLTDFITNGTWIKHHG